MAESQPTVEKCCTKKMVGNISYTLSADFFQGELPSQCRNGCVYTVTGTARPKFCFQRGDLPTECISEIPDSSCKSKCGLEGTRRIVGGENSTAGKYPWIMAMNLGSTSGSNPGRCAATLVASICEAASSDSVTRPINGE